MADRIKEAGHDALEMLLLAVALEPHGNQRVIMRPDRPNVIAHRVKAHFALGKCADTPAGEHVRLHEALRDLVGTHRIGNPAPESVPGIGADDPGLMLAPIKGQAVKAFVLHPERLFEGIAKPACEILLTAGLRLVTQGPKNLTGP